MPPRLNIFFGNRRNNRQPDQAAPIAEVRQPAVNLHHDLNHIAEQNLPVAELVAAQNQPDLEPAVPQNPPPRVVVRERNLRRQFSMCRLSDLRLEDENDVDLISVPFDIRLPRVQVDAESAGLTGRAYLEFLSKDIRLLPAIQLFMSSENILNNLDLDEAAFERITDRLRPVMAEAYLDDELGDRIDALAQEAMGYCVDKSDHIIGEMQSAALLKSLDRGDINDNDLYNIGIDFFKKEEITRAVNERLNVEAGGGIVRQNVHDHHLALFFLQDKLSMITKYERPFFNNVSCITYESCSEIGDAVTKRLTEHDGQHAMAFMSAWSPWVQHVNKQEKIQRDAKAMDANFHEELDLLVAQRDIPGSRVGRMQEKQYMDKCAALANQNDAWHVEIVGQYTKEFLMNTRAELRTDEAEGEVSRMPAFFRNVR